MFKLTLGRNKFLIRILYKSGQDQIMWVYNFDCQFPNTLEKVSYTVVSATTTPIFIGVDNIEAIWQVDYRRSVWSVIKSMRPASYFRER